jgi:hypothetical protein
VFAPENVIRVRRLQGSYPPSNDYFAEVRQDSFASTCYANQHIQINSGYATLGNAVASLKSQITNPEVFYVSKTKYRNLQLVYSLLPCASLRNLLELSSR